MGKPTGFLEHRRKGAIDREVSERLKDWQELHDSFDEQTAREQASRCMNCGTPFCHAGVNWRGVVSGCPLGNLIPEWNELVYRGLYQQAYERLKITAPFPEFTSRVCPALCEGACTAGLHDEAVSIREIERFLSDMAFQEGWEQPNVPEERTGKKVAVIGSGPAGLATAWALNRKGHCVTVYEKSDRPGGLLMYGIPAMKLSKDVVMRRVDLMIQEGISFVLNADVTEKKLSEEISQNFDAIALCCGTGIARDLNVKGRELDGVELAVRYLTEATKCLLDGQASEPLKGKNVIVIGGGDTGNDCVATAIRQGAASVKQLEIMPPSPEKRADDNPWPRWPFVLKTDYGQQEAAHMFGGDPREYCVNTEEIAGKDCVQSIKTVRVEWKDVNGRRTPVTIDNSGVELEADKILLAMGFIGADENIFASFGVDKTNQFAAGGKVFVAGDMRTGQSLVVKALSEGLNVADKIDAFLAK